MLETMGIRRMLIPVPFPLAEAQGTLLQLLPTPPLTRDQVELLKTDNIASREEPGLSDLGIEPTALEAILPSYIT
jgi:NADH dehydrogenase